MNSIKVIVHLQTTTENVAEAERIISSLVAPTRAHKGNLEFRAFQDLQDATKFTLVENWESLDDVHDHAETDYMAEFVAKKDELFPGSTTDVVKEF